MPPRASEHESLILLPNQLTEIPDGHKFRLKPTFPDRVDTVPEAPEIINFPFHSQSLGTGVVRLERDFDVTKWIKLMSDPDSRTILLPGRNALTKVEITRRGIIKLLEYLPTVPTFIFQEAQKYPHPGLIGLESRNTRMFSTSPIMDNDIALYKTWSNPQMENVTVFVNPVSRVFDELLFAMVSRPA